MRKLGIAIAVIVVLLIAAVLIVPHLIDVNQYHGQIQSQLEKRLGRQVTLGKMGLRLFPPAFDVENTTIAEDPRFASGRPFATADKLAVSVKFWPLLRRKFLRSQHKPQQLQQPPVRQARSLLQLNPQPSSPQASSHWQTFSSMMDRLQLPISRSTSLGRFTTISI